MTDVGAVLLTIGEPSTARAMESIDAQVLPAAEIVVVKNVSPFHKALGDAARRTRSPFFVQVDADMVLDPDCFRELRAAVRPDTGVVVAELRDPMTGPTVGVKLFRTACFGHAEFSDSISPDTDFIDSIRRRGWKVDYVGRERGAATETRVLGAHMPEYTPGYTYRKYLLEGGRLRYRGARGGLRWRIFRLEMSDHALSRLALVALGHGFFCAEERDGLTTADDPAEAQELHAILGSPESNGAAPLDLIASVNDAPLREVMRRFADAGRATRATRSGGNARATIDALARAGDNSRWTVAKLSFAHGLASAAADARDQTGDESKLKEFLTLGVHRNAPAWVRAASRVRHLAEGLTGRRSWRW